MNKIIILSRQKQTLLGTNSVLRNTYFLLALTLAFSGMIATISTIYNFPYLGIIPTFTGIYGLMFLTHRFCNSAYGVLAAFAFTGFLGYCLGPILNTSLSHNGMSSVIIMALLGTALVFLCCSSYVLTTRRNMSFLNGMLISGFVVLLVTIIANMFLHLNALRLTICALFILFSTASILWETSNIIHGGENNYIRATVSLYASLYNIFMSLLGFASKN